MALLPWVHRAWINLGQRTHEFTRQQFWIWLTQGFALPCAFWVVLNSGWLLDFPPVVPDLVRPAGSIFQGVLKVSAIGLATVGSVWLAASYLWFASSILIRSPEQNRAELRSRCIWDGVLLLPPAIALGYWMGWPGVAFAALLFLIPFTHDTLPLIQWTPKPASYSRAMGEMRFGRYDQAEMAVIEQLEVNEEDFEGWMMLAELYAAHFGDLTSADETIRELCDQPTTSISECAVALHRLADWHLKIGKNPVAARDALEGICLKYPGTHLDRMARQRIDQLPATREDFLRQQAGRRIPLHPRPHPSAAAASASPSPEAVVPEVSDADARTQDETFVRQLELDPNDVEARERYARALAGRPGRHESELEQLRSLLDAPGQPEEKRLQWLQRAADIELRHNRNFSAAKVLLEELIHENPRSPLAFPAQRQLSLLTLEMKIRKSRERREQARQAGETF